MVHSKSELGVRKIKPRDCIIDSQGPHLSYNTRVKWFGWTYCRFLYADVLLHWSRITEKQNCPCLEAGCMGILLGLISACLRWILCGRCHWHWSPINEKQHCVLKHEDGDAWEVWVKICVLRWILCGRCHWSSRVDAKQPSNIPNTTISHFGHPLSSGGHCYQQWINTWQCSAAVKQLKIKHTQENTTESGKDQETRAGTQSESKYWSKSTTNPSYFLITASLDTSVKKIQTCCTKEEWSLRTIHQTQHQVIGFTTPRYPQGRGLRGPFFICRGFDVSMGRSVPFYDIMIARYLDISVRRKE
jgi:hypothetical protein